MTPFLVSLYGISEYDMLIVIRRHSGFQYENGWYFVVHDDNEYDFPRENKVMTFGERLLKERRRRGWTQQVLADRAGVSQTFIARLECGGIKDPSGSTLRGLALAMGLTTDYLLGLGVPADTADLVPVGSAAC